MRKETAGADAGVVRHALHNANQYVAPAVELRDRTAAVAHTRAGTDRSTALGIDETAVPGVGDEARLLQAGGVHAVALMRGAVTRDREGSIRRGAGFDRHDTRRKRACEREL